jgi:hypothetical protein
MQTKPTPAEGINSAKQKTESASCDAACSPFPWTLDLAGECIRRADGEIIAETHISTKIPRKEADANARHIAALPHLIAAIKAFEAEDNFAGWNISYAPAIKDAREALRIISENV